MKKPGFHDTGKCEVSNFDETVEHFIMQCPMDRTHGEALLAKAQERGQRPPSLSKGPCLKQGNHTSGHPICHVHD